MKGNKIALALRARTVCILWKIYKYLLDQIGRVIMSLLANNVHEKTLQKVKTHEILKASARFC